jgi:pimeloyl-ACP methyl ester carboxylesterase
MVLKPNEDKIPSNSPVEHIPPDYYPEGCGFWFEIPEGLDAGKKMFYRDSIHGTGTPESTIVFVHGNPEASYTYAKAIKHLINMAQKPIRIVAMDNIGFGLSDQATYEMVCMDHSENLLQLIKTLDLSNVTLIIHDWSGPIGVGAFLKVPTLVSNLVLLNTTVFPIPKETGIIYTEFPSKEFAWTTFPDVVPNDLWGRLAAMMVTMPGGSGRMPGDSTWHPTQEMGIALLKNNYSLDNESVAQRFYREMFNSDSNVMSSKRLVRQCEFWAEGNIYKEPKLGDRDTGPFYR